jgi:purine-nucleoside/S-methyl-5'-thioadenosine phosphorylase / adenosine deaminase
MSAIELPDSWLIPDWPAAEHVRAFTTTRQAPASTLKESTGELDDACGNTHYEAFNLGLHVGDDQHQVLKNRSRLAQLCHLESGNFCWLDQVHGSNLIDAATQTLTPQADASYTQAPKQACVIMTADCLPVLFCDRQGSQVAAAHAGWRSLAAGILEKTAARFNQPDEVMAWFGPAISQQYFEVGHEVYQIFCQRYPEAEHAFVASSETGKWFADLYQLARLALRSGGVDKLYGGQYCSFGQAQKFYSFRRDKHSSGRMASVIYLDQ